MMNLKKDKRTEHQTRGKDIPHFIEPVLHLKDVILALPDVHLELSWEYHFSH